MTELLSNGLAEIIPLPDNLPRPVLHADITRRVMQSDPAIYVHDLCRVAFLLVSAGFHTMHETLNSLTPWSADCILRSSLNLPRIILPSDANVTIIHTSRRATTREFHHMDGYISSCLPAKIFHSNLP